MTRARTTTRRLAVCAALASMGLLASACGAEGGDEGSAVGADLGSLTSSLGALPDRGEEATTVQWTDFDRASEVAGVERPDDEATDDEVRDWALAVSVARDPAGESKGVAVVMPPAANAERSLTQLDEFRKEMGWSITDVERFVSEEAPPSRATVMDGDFSADDLGEALGEDDDGLWSIGDGGGTRDLSASSAARPLGESMLVLLDDERLVVARQTDTLTTRDDLVGGTTYADDEEMVAVAEALDDGGAFTAMLVPQIGSGRPLGPARDCDAAPVEARGFAQGVVDDEVVMLLAYAHEDEGDAEANAGVLRALLSSNDADGSGWSEDFSEADVEVSGTVVRATLTPREPIAASRWREPVATFSDILLTC